MLHLASAWASKQVAGPQALGKQVQFDVIVMDPPWQLAGSAPTRGVREHHFAISIPHTHAARTQHSLTRRLLSNRPALARTQVALGYKQLHNKDIEKIPIPLLQTNGFLFIWVINARYAFALDLMEKWGYK